MSNVINIYTNYTPRELSDLLMSEVAIGDAHELHNTCIVLCELASKLSARIAALEDAEAQRQADESMAFNVALYTPSKD